MKRRFGYVSNSSSSSFVILNWSQLDEAKKSMVLNYRQCVRELWEKNHLPIKEECGSFFIDFKALPEHSPSAEFVESHSVDEIAQWMREHKDAGELHELASKLDFGWVDDYWRFREKDGRLEMTTSMDNFDMGKWMDYIGGIECEWTGEDFGLFKDEQIEFDKSNLSMLEKPVEDKTKDDAKGD